MEIKKKLKTNSKDYRILFEKCYSIFNKIQEIIIVALNDVYFEEYIELLENNCLIKDTVKALEIANYDLDNLFEIERLKLLFQKEKSKEELENKFFTLSLCMDEVIHDELIIKQKENKILIEKIKNENIKISKKNYEVEILANYMIHKLSCDKIDTVIEMGCGKSYLTERLFEYDENLIYVGIDKEADLIKNSDFSKENMNKNKFVKNKRTNILNNYQINNDKGMNENNLDKKGKKISNKSQFSNNIFLYNLTIDENFYNSYESIIKVDIKERISKYDEDLNTTSIKKGDKLVSKILLFGLHSCGNLTSDTIKVFSEENNNEFKSLIIISCCLHLVKEFISEEAKNSTLFNNHIKNIGFDGSGNFLDETLIYDRKYNNIGYPISNFIKDNFQDLFFTRTIRKSSMQSFPEKEKKLIDLEDFFYKTRFFRTLFQAFLVEFLPELKSFYGYGDVEYDKYENSDFDKFISYLKINLNKIKNEHNKVGKKFRELFKENLDVLINKFEDSLENKEKLIDFYSKYKQKDKILWACFLIKMKFSKIVELMIILDRVIYLIEKDIKTVELVEIFDYSKSKRNYLIYANK